MRDEAYTSAQAWADFDNQNYIAAGKMWLWLMSHSSRPAIHNQYRLNYTYVLCARHLYLEGIAILQELFEATGLAIYLHHMGCIALEQGDLPAAQAYLKRERDCLGEDQLLALAAHTCALGRVRLGQKDFAAAQDQANQSLAFARTVSEPILESAAHQLLGDILTAMTQNEAATLHYATAFARQRIPPRHPALMLSRKPIRPALFSQPSLARIGA